MRKWTGSILVAALVGCAGVQEGSWERGAGLFGDGTGYQPLVMVTMPTSTCDLPAFVLGFKDSYVLHWNQQVSTKIAQHSADMLKPSPEGAAQNSPSTYQALLIGASPAGGQTTFPNRCRSQSYVNGQAAGVKKAEVNFNLLPAQPTR